MSLRIKRNRNDKDHTQSHRPRKSQRVSIWSAGAAWGTPADVPATTTPTIPPPPAAYAANTNEQSRPAGSGSSLSAACPPGIPMPSATGAQNPFSSWRSGNGFASLSAAPGSRPLGFGSGTLTFGSASLGLASTLSGNKPVQATGSGASVPKEQRGDGKPGSRASAISGDGGQNHAAGSDARPSSSSETAGEDSPAKHDISPPAGSVLWQRLETQQAELRKQCRDLEKRAVDAVRRYQSLQFRIRGNVYEGRLRMEN